MFKSFATTKLVVCFWTLILLAELPAYHPTAASTTSVANSTRSSLSNISSSLVPSVISQELYQTSNHHQRASINQQHLEISSLLIKSIRNKDGNETFGGRQHSLADNEKQHSLNVPQPQSSPTPPQTTAPDGGGGGGNRQNAQPSPPPLTSLIINGSNSHRLAPQLVLTNSRHSQLTIHPIAPENNTTHSFPSGRLDSSGEPSPLSLRRERRLVAAAAQEVPPDCEFQVSRKPALFGLRCDEAEVTDDGVVVIKAHHATRLHLIGRNLYKNITVAITAQEASAQDDCTHFDRIKSLRLMHNGGGGGLNVAIVIVELPPPVKEVPYYLCLREDSPEAGWYHQGSEAWLKIYVKQDLLPLWMKFILIACLLGLSGLFSGLNLGLMSLDMNELQVIKKCGTQSEKRYATAIEPVRRRGNYLLCSILFSNTLVNSTISVILEDLSDGLIAIITSTVLIVLFGEILPQAFCSRHGLAVGARTIWLTNFCMFITFPLSYPVSYCLDWVLGKEIGHAYDRERLMEFIHVTKDVNNLEADEVNIISGALRIKSVTISKIMTRIEDVYMLDEEAVLDFDTIQAIVSKGYSRIPVHETGNRRNIKAVLFAKDLALVDPDDRTPVQTMINFYNHPRMFVYEDTTLDKALNEFKTGKSHMAIVQRIVCEDEKDPYYEVTGVVTLEDVIEEIMQMQINDETDTLFDNQNKRRRKDAQVRRDFSQFTNLGTGDSSFNVVTPQLCLAAYQYLSTTVEPFTQKHLSDSILRRLLSQRIFYKAKVDDEPEVKRLYTAGEPADYFIMILEGRVHVVCGTEKLVFDGGPFSYFGRAALQQTGDSPSQQQHHRSTSEVAAIASAAMSSSQQRKDSTAAAAVATTTTTSRRDSLAKAVVSQLQLGGKKSISSGAQSEAVVAATLGSSQNRLSPSGGGAGATSEVGGETMELLERGSYYFMPDYTVDIIANTSYLKVTRNDYLTALRATQIERESAEILGDELEVLPLLDASPKLSIEQGLHDSFTNA